MAKTLVRVLGGKAFARTLAFLKATIRPRGGGAAAALIGCALLSGTAQAQYRYLDEHEVDNRVPHPPVYFAAETITCANTTQVGNARYCNVEFTDGTGNWSRREVSSYAVIAQSKTALESDEGWFLRIALDGAAFRKLTASTQNNSTTFKRVPSQAGVAGALNSTLIQGGTGYTQAVYRLRTDVGLNEWIGFFVAVTAGADLAVADANPGDVTVSMTLHSDQFDAINGANAISTAYFGGTSVLLRKIKGLDMQVKTGTPAVADVATSPVGFLWFVNQAGNRHAGTNSAATTAANASNVRLGCAVARPLVPPGVRVGPLDARDGNVATTSDLMATNGVSVKVEGDLSIGAFDVVKEGAMKAVNCPARRGSARTPMTGNIKGTTAKPREAMLAGQADGAYHLCLEVDNAGAGSNRSPIAAQEFKGTLSVTPAAAGQGVLTKEGVIGRILRNGASVNLAYLTTSAKYNQRLVITNRGPTPATYNLAGFTTDTGTTVGLSDAAMQARAAGRNVVPAMGQAVLRVADLLKFTGAGRRASATLSLNASSTNIQVATTQVNLQDGSTDTVLYAPEADAPPAAASGC